MTVCRIAFLSFAATVLLTSLPAAHAQSAAGTGSGTAQQTQPGQPGQQAQSPASESSSAMKNQTEPAVVYHRPSEREKLRNFAFDAFGPYPFIVAAVGGAYLQAYPSPTALHARGTPPEWGQGAQGYGERVGSTYGIELVSTTTRYVLGEALREDTLYYRCACSGFFPRLGHAIFSTVLARRGEDGHYFFSLANLGAPYAGTMTAALGWYPGRYDAMDGFRMGNVNLGVAAAQNVALEFIYGGPHTVLGRVKILRGHSSDNTNP